VSSSEVSVLGPRHWAAGRRGYAQRAERPLIRLVTFGALALYGSLRWSTLMRPAPVWRLVGLCAVAVAVAAAGAAFSERHRRIGWAVMFVGLIAIFPISGFPFSWVRHVRIAVTADAIGQGLTALPNTLVPYLGINQWVRAVVVLGAGLLLLDAALLAGYAPKSLGDLRRAGAALPLIALAIVPMTLVKPSLPYLQGLILFALLAAFMWAERAPTRDAVTALLVIGLAGLAGLAAAPRVDPRSPWINPRGLAGALLPRQIDRFDWSQTYGPLIWPTHGTEVLDVQAAHPEYWKTENLDVFSGRVWTQGYVSPPIPAGDLVSGALARWTQKLQVTIRAMRTPDIIAAGTASEPTDVAEGVIPGESSGTWQVAAAQLEPGDSYRVTVYDPQPTPAQLAAAGTAYPATLVDGFMKMVLPAHRLADGTAVGPEQVLLPPFGESGPIYYGPTVANAAQELSDSPYARAYALATRLAGESRTPYAFAERVFHYLRHGFTYDTATPLTRYPLETFLFKTRSGYCQQFAGAMALLLRMGGVPARVAVGFTTGQYDSATHAWVVKDTDAHAWVEAYFPGYGWVKFDPTPPATLPPASGSASPAARKVVDKGSDVGPHGLGRSVGNVTSTPSAGSSLPVLPAIALIIALLAGAALIAYWRRPGAALSGDELVAELDQAMRRCGRPIGDGVTLATLEQRFRNSEPAASYVRAIRLARYRGAGVVPTRFERRALRRQLALGLGLGARLRALWALPPRR
jgi:transglutaminase-like putative cysteine protease